MLPILSSARRLTWIYLRASVVRYRSPKTLLELNSEISASQSNGTSSHRSDYQADDSGFPRAFILSIQYQRRATCGGVVVNSVCALGLQPGSGVHVTTGI